MGGSKDNAWSIIFGFNFYMAMWENVPPVGSVGGSKRSACTIVNQIKFSLDGWRGRVLVYQGLQSSTSDSINQWNHSIVTRVEVLV